MLQLRAYKAEFNIEWLPPPKVPFIHPSKSGDKSGLPEVDLKRPQYYFSRSCCNTDIDELTEKSGYRTILNYKFNFHLTICIHYSFTNQFQIT